MSKDERNSIASLQAEIERLRAALTQSVDSVKRLLAENAALRTEAESGAAVQAFNAIAKLCGCEQWEYPGQLVRDVERLRAALDWFRRRESLIRGALGQDAPAVAEYELLNPKPGAGT
jgi:hypothetical protein